VQEAQGEQPTRTEQENNIRPHRTLSQTSKIQKKLLISNQYQFGYSVNSTGMATAARKIEFLVDMHTGKLDASFSTACVKKVPYRAAHLRQLNPV